MTAAERRRLVKEGVAMLRQCESETRSLGGNGEPVRFESYAEAIAYNVAVARQAGLDEVVFNEVVLTVVDIGQEELTTAADLLDRLKYRDVDGVTGRGLPSKQAALARALWVARFARLAWKAGGRPSH